MAGPAYKTLHVDEVDLKVNQLRSHACSLQFHRAGPGNGEGG